MNKNLFKVLIADDDPENCSMLSAHLSKNENVKVVDEANTPEKAVYSIVKHYPDLIFLDINMHENSGLELLRILRKSNVDIPVAMISSFKDDAVKAIQNEVYDFILKPGDTDEIKRIVEKYRQNDQKDLPAKLMEVLHSIKEETKIRINSNHSYLLIAPEEIVYCKANDGFTNIYLTNGKSEFSNTSLSNIEHKIRNHNFYRLGRSILINLDYIRSVNKSSNQCILHVNGSSWEISASHKSIKKLLISNYNYA
jgi:two-component system LytT family response regulator